jgi:pyruvate carboxylase
MRLTDEQIQKFRKIDDCHKIDLYMLQWSLDTIEAQQQEIDRLKTQNKLLFEALMCLPGAMGATVTQEVCRICLRKGECEECLIDKAIREAMGK